MRFNNTRDQEIEKRSVEVFKILNGYENIDRNIFFQLRKIEGLEDMKLH